ncbi:MAG: hypothetical protein JKY56_19485 [Kofleriaceae bacterium]|nr:hypothetical protein [Kofleriaceae bacterium]
MALLLFGSGCLFAAFGAIALLSAAGASVTHEAQAPHPVNAVFQSTAVVASHGNQASEVGVPANTMSDSIVWVSFDDSQTCFQYDFNQVYNPEDGKPAPYTDPRVLEELGLYTNPGDSHSVALTEVRVVVADIVADRWPHQVESGSVTKCYPSRNQCDEMRTTPTYRTELRRTIVRHIRGTGVMCAPSTFITKDTTAIGIELSRGLANTRFQWNLSN